MAIIVKFVGALRNASGRDSYLLNYEECSVRELIYKLVLQTPELKGHLVHEEVGDTRPKGLILVNGREISVINGLNTALKDGDEIVLVPVAHGG